MKADEWQQINNLFHAALEREPGERAAFLAHDCAGDEGVRREVESLLASHDPSDSFIESLAPDLAAGLLAESHARLATGQSVGNYRVMALLGTGGMGEVYLTEDTRLGRRVALKLLPEQFTTEPDRLHRFEREARAASSLNHPNIITIHEVGQVEGQPFIITEFIEGKTLRQQMAAARLRLQEALDVAIQVASALEAAHKAGIVHRDIKPENIMLRPDGLVKVLDFGLAKLTEAQPPGPGAQATTLASVQTKIGLVMGTVTYMSPEQARGLAVDARSDIFSLGTVIYEMIAGQVPFEGATNSDMIVSILEREPMPLSLYAPGAPADLERIVRKALARDREERYQLAKDLLIDLRNLKQEMELQAKLDAVRPAGSKGATPAGLRLSVDTDEQLTTRSTDAEVALTVPSAAYLVGKIKTHKRAVALGLAVLMIAGAAIIYFIYFTRGEAIDSIAVLSGDKKKQLARNYTQNTLAYQRYVLGMYFMREGTPEALQKAIDRFEEASKIDPNYTLAYTGLYSAYHRLGQAGHWLPTEARVRMEWAALKAVELDDTSTEAHLFLATIKKINWDWAGSEKEYKRALELDPNEWRPYFSYAAFLLDVGRPDEAMPYAQRVEELDREQKGSAAVAMVYLYKGQYDKAIELYLKRINISIELRLAYVANGMPQEALNLLLLDKVAPADQSPVPWDGFPMRAYIYAMAGRRAEALQILRQQQQAAKQQYVSPFNFAIIYTGLGEKDLAFEYLKKACEEHVVVLSHFAYGPMFESLHSDPRYKALLRRMNLPA